MQKKRKIRSSRAKVFCKKDVLRNFSKFTGIHLWQTLFFKKVPSPRLFLQKKWLLQKNKQMKTWIDFYLTFTFTWKLSNKVPLLLVPSSFRHLWFHFLSIKSRIFIKEKEEFLGKTAKLIVFIVIFEHISDFTLMFLMLTLNK